MKLEGSRETKKIALTGFFFLKKKKPRISSYFKAQVKIRQLDGKILSGSPLRFVNE